MRCSALIWIFVLLAAATGVAGDVELYKDQVKPVLKERCFACHGALKQEANLRLDTVQLMIRGGDSGSIINRQSPIESLLLERISESDEALRMPPEGEPLAADQIAAIQTWLTSGAKGPDNEQPEPDPDSHWAFLAPQAARPPALSPALSPALPAAQQSGRSPSTNPIDAWIEARHRDWQLIPLPQADRRLLLRRLAVDLIGIPPSPAEIEQFLNDSTPDAYEQLVEQYLADPRHGERWARHWMDVWRYTDWYGLGKQLRNSQKHIWHWRDWIIESLNDDKGYNRMVVEMLAGDELAPADPETLRATGFLARNYYLFNRTTWLDETIEHTSKAFLGLTMNCCKCHDHKYDPMSQVDYYRMRAVFEPYHVRLDPVPGVTDLERNGLPRAYDQHLDRPTYVHVRGNDQQPDKDQQIAPGVPTSLPFTEYKLRQLALPPQAHHPALQEFVLQDQRQRLDQSVATAEQAFAQAKQAIDAARGRTSLIERLAELPPVFEDAFQTQSDTDWRYIDGEWSFTEQGLEQSKIARQRAALEARFDVPHDFVARLKFRTLGGDTYKSVGLCFDVTDQTEKLVYLSAHAPDPKLQASFKRNNQSAFPADGKVSRPVELDRSYDVVVAVRDRLVNVWIDGELVLAYAYPFPREPGALQLIAFDAQVVWEQFRLAKLPTDTALAAVGQIQQSQSPAVAEAQARVREVELRVARVQREQILASLFADRATAGLETGNSVEQRIETATAAQHELKIAEAELAVAKAELELAKSNAKNRVQSKQKLDQAQKSLANVQQKPRNQWPRYESFRASRKALEGPDETTEHNREPYPTKSTGRRLAFARWIVDRRNPLAARVVVNHVWLRHFGQPLVAEVTDFGRRSPRPDHAELLDWLAVDLMAHNWSLKRLHRLIVTSKAYQRSSSIVGSAPKNLAVDPQNRWYWRRLPVRMESQVIRDAMLSVAQSLSQQMYGPSVPVNAGQSVGRRSVYFEHSRDDQQPFLTMFDDANILACYRRSESVVPQQALTLANSQLSFRAAQKIADALSRELGSDATARDFAESAWERLLGTQPSHAELDLCESTYQQIHALLSNQGAPDPAARARRDLVHALLNHNDFITIR